MEQAYADINYIISNLDSESLKKIPKELIQFFLDNADKNYKTTLTTSKLLEEQELNPKTEELICMITLNYLVNEEQKQELLKKLNQNEKSYQELLEKKYNHNNLFENRKENNEYIPKNNIQETSLVEYKENIFIRFKKYILKLLH